MGDPRTACGRNFKASLKQILVPAHPQIFFRITPRGLHRIPGGRNAFLTWKICETYDQHAATQLAVVLAGHFVQKQEREPLLKAHGYLTTRRDNSQSNRVRNLRTYNADTLELRFSPDIRLAGRSQVAPTGLTIHRFFRVLCRCLTHTCIQVI